MIQILFLSLIISQVEWVIEEVDSVQLDADCPIAIDTGSYPHIAYPYWQHLGGNLYLVGIKYAKRNITGWEFQWVDTAIGGYLFSNPRLSLDKYNRPHIAYTKDTSYIKYAYYDGNSWQISTVDSFNSGRFYPYRRLDMVLAEDSIPHISYPFLNKPDSIYGVRYAYKSGDSWRILTLWEERGIFPPATSIAIDSIGLPYIAFGDYRSATSIAYLCCAHFDGQNWEIDTIQASDEPYIVYSIKVNDNNQPCLVYLYDFHIHYGEKISSGWRIEIVWLSAYGYAAGDLEMDGNSPSLVYSSTFDPVSYWYKIDTTWYAEIVEPNYPGLFPSLAKDRNGNMHVAYCRVRNIYGELCYAQRNPSVINEKEMRQISTPEPLPKIYPNPASSVVCVRFNPPSPPFNKGGNKRGDLEIRIYDVCGKLVQEILRSVPNEKEVISLKGIKSGVYFLKIKTEKGEVEKRLVILR